MQTPMSLRKRRNRQFIVSAAVACRGNSGTRPCHGISPQHRRGVPRTAGERKDSQENAWHNYYLLAQIAHLLLQLCWLGDAVRAVSNGTYAAMAKAFRTIRNFTDRLRQALCTATGPPLGGRIDAAAIQIRFSSACPPAQPSPYSARSRRDNPDRYPPDTRGRLPRAAATGGNRRARRRTIGECACSSLTRPVAGHRREL